ncbi:MAG TPA: sulfatase-like hydrolase/transferase, partial [Candidatus Saccharimonadia bacterium]
FIFAHFINPHSPYVFTKDGGVPTYRGDENDLDIPRRDKYVNQVEYVNQTIGHLVADIKANATKPPIIIIQADEGPYPMKQPSAWQTASADTLQLKFGSLAAYYLPDASPEESANVTSSVNIFRFVFNRYFGTSMPYLPDCSFVFNNTDRPFKFYAITSEFHPEDPECQRYN